MQVATGRTSHHAQPGYERFDSHLEYRIYLSLKERFKELEKAKEITLVMGLPKWVCDFYIPSQNLIVEVKGHWVQLAKYTTEKKLFAYQWALALQQFNGIILSDCQFKIYNYEVKTFDDWNL